MAKVNAIFVERNTLYPQKIKITLYGESKGRTHKKTFLLENNHINANLIYNKAWEYATNGWTCWPMLYSDSIGFQLTRLVKI